MAGEFLYGLLPQLHSPLVLLSLCECLCEYIVISRKHTALREPYLYTHQRFRV